MKQIKEEKGITLIALVVTIVVLLILAGISINAIIGDNGIVGKAKDAQNKMEEAIESDKNALNSLNKWMDEILKGPEPIDKTTSYVGYYADFEGDGEIDGIIYADLAIGESGTWSTTNSSTYSYSAVEDKSTLKNYVISQESYTVEGATGYGTKPVLKATGTGGTKDRFYVMALSDVTNSGTKDNNFTWYDAAYDDGITEYASITSTSFGAGKNNTTVMINSWNRTAYGAQNDNTNGYLDMWGVIQEENKQGWFVPSKKEWSAFAQNLGITSNNYCDFGLDYYYWSSSLDISKTAWGALFYDGYLDRKLISISGHVRLSATF